MSRGLHTVDCTSPLLTFRASEELQGFMHLDFYRGQQIRDPYLMRCQAGYPAGCEAEVS